MAGLGQAIIIIRGMDLASKTIQQVARNYEAAAERMHRAGVRAMTRGMPTVSAGLFREEELARAEAQWAGSVARIQNIATGLGATGLMMSAAITLPLVGAAKSIADVSIQFDKYMGNIQSISKETATQTAELGQRFVDLSTDIKRSVATPLELADAYYEIQSAGFYGADAEKLLERTTKAATAGLADQTQTAKATAVALHAYGVGSEEASHFTDVMVRAVDIGVFRFDDLVQQMGDFIAAAGMMKIPIEEVMAAMTTMTKRGLQSSEAATSLNRILTAFFKPSKQAVAVAEEYGITLSANTLKAKGLAQALGEIIEKTKGDEDVLADIFGEQRAIRGVFAIASDGAKMFNDDIKQLGDSAGTVDQIFGTQTQRWWAQFQNLKNVVSELAIDLGEELVPMMLEFVNTDIKPLISDFKDLTDGQQKLAIQIGTTAAIIGPLLIGFGVILNALTKVVSVFHTAAPTIAAITKGLTGFATLNPTAAVFGIAKVTEEMELQALALQLTNEQYKEVISLKQQMEGLKFRVYATENEHLKELYKTQMQVIETKYNLIMGYIDEEAALKILNQGYGSAEIGMSMLDLAMTTSWPTLSETEYRLLGVAGAMGVMAEAGVTAMKVLSGIGTLRSGETMPAGYGTDKGQPLLPWQMGENPLTGKTGWEQWWDNLQANTDIKSIDQVIANLNKGLGKASTSGADQFEKAFDRAVSAVTDKLDQGIKDSIGLLDLTGGTYGGGPQAPGAGGPFEDIFRIQDVAAAKERGKGKDTDKWMEMFFPGMSLDDASAAAKDIVKKFQLGLWQDPEVTKFINFQGLVDTVLLESAAQAQLDAFSKALAVKAMEQGANPDAINAVLGRMGIAPSSPIPDLAPAVTNLLAGMDTSLAANQNKFIKKGGDMMALIESGMIKRARESNALYDVVSELVDTKLNNSMGPR